MYYIYQSVDDDIYLGVLF